MRRDFKIKYPAQDASKSYMDISPKKYGLLSEKYVKARREYPKEILDYLWSFIDIPNPKILDVGCGTGIASRQLAQRGAEVTGSDRDEDMIRFALENNHEGINYVIAESEHLPFGDGTFDAVTAFSSFHWFAYESALQEIRRVLKDGGTVFIANKEDGELRKDYRQLMDKFMIPRVFTEKIDYNPLEMLNNLGFHSIDEKVFQAVDSYTLEDGMDYLESTSLWNQIPEDKKQVAKEATESFCKDKLNSAGLLERAYEVRTIMGTK